MARALLFFPSGRSHLGCKTTARITLNSKAKGRHAGFTLVELMIAIIAFLSSIAISVY